jgi:hypothetical protein
MSMKMLLLAKELGIGHQHLFTDQLRKPAWKVIILKHNPRSPKGDLRADALFIAHHGLADGTSCAAFHMTFFKYLCQASSQRIVQSDWPYTVPPTIVRPRCVEEALAFNVGRESISIDTNTIVEVHPFDAWTAAPPSLPSECLGAGTFEGKIPCPVEASMRIRLSIYTDTPI